MIHALGYADTMMVASVGEAAVAGIAIVNSFNKLIKVMMSALSIGGCIVVSQYIGKGERENASKAMKMTYYSVFLLALLLGLILFIFRDQFLSLISGEVEEGVFISAQTFFLLSIFSYPAFAIYYVISAAFRAVGKSRMSMVCSLIMMALNLIIKAVLIYAFNMGVLGAGISTLLAVVFIAVMLTILACRKSETAYIHKLFYLNLDFRMIKKIFFVGIPNSIESGMFQFGLVLLQRLTASFGTASLAANSILKNITPFSNLPTQCFGMVAVTVVGQCMGAKKIDQAKFYTKYLLKLAYIFSFLPNILCIVFNNSLVGAFHLSAEASRMAIANIYVFCLGSLVYYPTSFTMAQALRATGDTRFTMVSSIGSMFGARIGLAYVFGAYMNMGLSGIWLAMQVDWIVRSIIFVTRFIRGKWQSIRIV